MANEKGLTVPGQETALVSTSGSLFFDVKKFEHAKEVAKILVIADMVPEVFRNNIGNCLIALNYAERIGADPFMLMQNMHVIHGKPGLEGKLIIALVNQCGRFEPLEFDEGPDYCVAQAKELKSGKLLVGPRVDMAMVKGEGWLDKQGSKWKTMPQIMFRYRSAAFFARTYCPEVTLGMQTVDEIHDVVDLRPTPSGAYEAEKPEKAKTVPKDEDEVDYLKMIKAIAYKVKLSPESTKTEVDSFIEQSAKAQDKDVADFKRDAIEAGEAFKNAFINFYKSQEADDTSGPETSKGNADQDAEDGKTDAAAGENDPPDEPEANFWDDRPKWINLRTENFTHLVRLGSGLETPRPRIAGEELTTHDIEVGFDEMRKKYPDAVGTLGAASQEMKAEVKRKLLNAIGNDAFQAFVRELAELNNPEEEETKAAGEPPVDQRQLMIDEIEVTFAKRLIDSALFKMQRNPGQYPEDLAGVGELYDTLMSGNGQ